MKTSSIAINLLLILSLALSGWAKQSDSPSAGLEELFPGKLLDSDGKEVSKDVIAGKTVGIYFSAHWCPPCRTFTPSLVKFRDEHKDDFEIVFVSSDKNEAAQRSYMKETKMKFLAVKFGSEDIKNLKARYKVRGIPSLIIVGPDGKTITTDGRGDVSKKSATALDSWKKKAGIKEA